MLGEWNQLFLNEHHAVLFSQLRLRHGAISPEDLRTVEIFKSLTSREVEWVLKAVSYLKRRGYYVYLPMIDNYKGK